MKKSEKEYIVSQLKEASDIMTAKGEVRERICGENELRDEFYDSFAIGCAAAVIKNVIAMLEQ